MGYRSFNDIVYEVNELLNKATQIAQENDGVIPDAMAEALDALEGEKEEKIDKLAMFIQYADEMKSGIAATIKKHEERLNDIEMRKEKATERLSFWLNNTGRETEDYKVSFRKTKRTMLSAEAEATAKLGKVPVGFERFAKVSSITKVSLPKDDIKKAIEGGEVVAGAWIEENYSCKVV